MLAVGATAMTTGMGNLDAVAAACAVQDHQVTSLAAAAPHGLQCLVVAWQQLVAMQALQFALVVFDHLGEEHHQPPSSQRSWKPSSSISMRSLL
jgi:hypothetical protein